MQSPSARVSALGPIETEGKWRLDSNGGPDQLRERLRALGARQLRLEHEVNLIFDFPDGRLLGSGRLLRLRIIDDAQGGRLTVKGPVAYAGSIKSREELETTVADAATTRAMLELLGYALQIEYPKVRETWQLGALEVALDELPFGSYCEIEGTLDTIERTARSLELTQPEPRGYPSLMQEHLAGRLTIPEQEQPGP